MKNRIIYWLLQKLLSKYSGDKFEIITVNRLGEDGISSQGRKYTAIYSTSYPCNQCEFETKKKICNIQK